MAAALIATGLAWTGPAEARTLNAGFAGLPGDFAAVDGGGSSELPSGLQCVPYARQVSGIQIRGDAWTWWDQAQGHYARGNRPLVGAVMAFRPYGRMQLGHVAAVSRVIDSRTVLLRHANWSPIDGERGQVENDVMAVDSSPNNDWSEVRVWFDPIKKLGTTRWPLAGFIYNRPAGSRSSSNRLAERDAAPTPQRVPHQLASTGYRSDPIGEIIATYSGSN
jgi:surface antigen